MHPCCRVCGAALPAPVLDLGLMPLANELHATAEESLAQERFPLALAVCQECGLAQITETVPPERLFADYPYFSGLSATFSAHTKALAQVLIARCDLGPGSRVVEIASNDGYLLKHFVARGIPCLGVEPAQTVAEAAEAAGVPTLRRFWSKALAEELAEAGRVDAIIACNVLAHIPDVNGAVAGVACLLKPGGAFVIETPYVRDLVRGLAADTIYHEHVFYYSVTSLCRLLNRHGLAISDVQHLPGIHGGSLRVVAEHALGRRLPTVDHLLAEEAQGGCACPEFYADFAERAQALWENLRWLYRRIGTGAGYGAAAKGAVLLNACHLRDWIAFVCDYTPAKQGRFMPGLGIPILHPETLLARRPPHALLLCWNFAAEVLAREQEYRQGGGRFVLPVPEVRLV